jgi:hypothetical protein
MDNHQKQTLCYIRSATPFISHQYRERTLKMICLALHRPKTADLPKELRDISETCPRRRFMALTQLVICQYSFVPRGYEILWSLSYRSTRYCKIAPLSQILSSLPCSSVSTMAGMRPLGLMSRNHSSFCSCAKSLIARAYMDCVRSRDNDFERIRGSYVVLQAKFLKCNGDLEWVGGAFTVESDHILG